MGARRRQAAGVTARASSVGAVTANVSFTAWLERGVATTVGAVTNADGKVHVYRFTPAAPVPSEHRPRCRLTTVLPAAPSFTEPFTSSIACGLVLLMPTLP